MMNDRIRNNYSGLRPRLFIFPVFLLVLIVLFLYGEGALNVSGYVEIQKDVFLSINHFLGRYPVLQHNLTQLGDVLIILPLITILIVYAPKIWEALLAGLLVSAVFSAVLKKLFAIPRPAAVLDHNTFIIMGKKLTGFNSLPSGHSITIFTVLTILLFAFMPKKWEGKTLWALFVVITGLILAFTRVGVGAHHPLDVISGSIIGYISGLSGIFISRKYKIGAWIGPKKYYPVFILLFLVCGGVLVTRIMNENLLVYYFSIISLAFSLYKIIQVYVQRR